jgi:hypothetical protein
MNSNGPGITEKMILLKEQLQEYVIIAKGIVETIKSEGISNYPIIIAHQDQLEIGITIVQKTEAIDSWSLNASTLEEFYTKHMIDESKLNDFRKLYNSHESDICFFVLSELGGQYLFLPYE